MSISSSFVWYLPVKITKMEYLELQYFNSNHLALLAPPKWKLRGINTVTFWGRSVSVKDKKVYKISTRYGPRSSLTRGSGMAAASSMTTSSAWPSLCASVGWTYYLEIKFDGSETECQIMDQQTSKWWKEMLRNFLSLLQPGVYKSNASRSLTISTTGQLKIGKVSDLLGSLLLKQGILT
jgi:hypothetical protein